MALPGVRNDPFPAFNFYVSLLDTSGLFSSIFPSETPLSGGFTECTGLDATLQVEDYNAGGVNDRVLKFPTRMTYANIVLKRGIGFNDELWKWHYDYVSGRGKRRDGVIILQSPQQFPLKVWSFRRGLPLKWAGPTLNASSSGIAIETVEIAHEGLELMTGGGSFLEEVGSAIASIF